MITAILSKPADDKIILCITVQQILTQKEPPNHLWSFPHLVQSKPRHYAIMHDSVNTVYLTKCMPNSTLGKMHNMLPNDSRRRKYPHMDRFRLISVAVIVFQRRRQKAPLNHN